MNEKIKETLLKVRGMEGEDGDLLPSLYSPEDIEKFAMMIIGECLTAIGVDNYSMLTGKAYCKDILYHFNLLELVEELDDE